MYTYISYLCVCVRVINYSPLKFRRENLTVSHLARFPQKALPLLHSYVSLAPRGTVKSHLTAYAGWKIEAAVPAEVQLRLTCFIITDFLCQLLPPVLHIRNCKNYLLREDTNDDRISTLRLFQHRFLIFAIYARCFCAPLSS
jgi:hypothetical protein